MGDHFRQGFERISSAPRLSFSSQDVFNLRNQKLSQLSHSSPGIYSSEKNLRQQKVICDQVTMMPKSILVKPKEDSISELAFEDEKEEKKSFYSIRLELQFTAFVFLFFVLVVVIPLSMIVMGSIYLYNCPAQIMIPIFLIAGGASFLFSIVLLKKLNRVANNSEEDQSCYRKTFSFAIMFQLGWFIAGCYWIYGTYQPDYLNEGSSSYCHKTLYQYSFWFINAIFLSLSLFAILFTIYVLFGRDQTTDPGTKV